MCISGTIQCNSQIWKWKAGSWEWQWKLKVSKKASKMSNFQNDFNTKKWDSWSISHMIKKLCEESFLMKLTTYWSELIEPRNHKKNVLCEGMQSKKALFDVTLDAISKYSPWISGIDAEAIGISQLWGQEAVKLGGIWLTCRAEDFGAGIKSDGSIKEEHYPLAASLCGCWQPITYTYMGSWRSGDSKNLTSTAWWVLVGTTCAKDPALHMVIHWHDMLSWSSAMMASLSHDPASVPPPTWAKCTPSHTYWLQNPCCHHRKNYQTDLHQALPLLQTVGIGALSFCHTVQKSLIKCMAVASRAWQIPTNGLERPDTTYWTHARDHASALWDAPIKSDNEKQQCCAGNNTAMSELTWQRSESHNVFNIGRCIAHYSCVAPPSSCEMQQNWLMFRKYLNYMSQ